MNRYDFSNPFNTQFPDICSLCDYRHTNHSCKPFQREIARKSGFCERAHIQGERLTLLSLEHIHFNHKVIPRSDIQAINSAISEYQQLFLQRSD